jgi:transcriptional regulator with XRE-family HTH domain
MLYYRVDCVSVLVAIHRQLTLCRRLRFLRERKKLTQEDLAEHLGISQAAYSRLEQGLIELSIDKLFKLADLYVMTVSELVKEL